MNILPDELIINILKNLTLNDLKSICVVSKFFDYICKELKICVDFFLINQFQFVTCINFISRHFKVSKLILPPSIVTKPVLIDYTSSKLKHIVDISIFCNNRFSKYDLKHFSKFKNIERFNMYNCKISSDGLKYIEEFKNLKTLKIRSNMYIDYNVLSTYSNKLQELSLTGPSSLTINDFSKLDKLKVIDFSSSECLRVRNINQDILHIIGKHCNLLEKLSLNYCRNINTEGLIYILKNCNITTLKLQGCEKVDKYLLKNIGNLKHLKYLDISHCNNINMEGLNYLKNCNNLEILYAYGVYYLDNSFFISIPEKLKKLRILRITCCNTNCINPLTYLSKCKNLNKLYFRGVNINEKDFDYFTENTENYISLDLGSCKNLNDTNLIKLNTNLLKILDINSPNFSKEMFTTLIKKSPYLNNISLYNIKNLDLFFFTEICKHIEYVFVDKIELNKDLYRSLIQMKNTKFL